MLMEKNNEIVEYTVNLKNLMWKHKNKTHLFFLLFAVLYTTRILQINFRAKSRPVLSNKKTIRLFREINLKIVINL